MFRRHNSRGLIEALAAVTATCYGAATTCFGAATTCYGGAVGAVVARGEDAGSELLHIDGHVDYPTDILHVAHVLGVVHLHQLQTDLLQGGFVRLVHLRLTCTAAAAAASTGEDELHPRGDRRLLRPPAPRAPPRHPRGGLQHWRLRQGHLAGGEEEGRHGHLSRVVLQTQRREGAARQTREREVGDTTKTKRGGQK